MLTVSTEGGTMKIFRSLAVAVAAGAMALGEAGGVAPVTSATASVASSRSAPRIQTMSPYGWGTRHGNWKVRPGTVYFGGGTSLCAAIIKHVHWTSYGRNSAYAAHVRAWLDRGPGPCASSGHWVNARAYFYGPAYHSGPGWNFSEVVITYQHGGTYLREYINRRGQWD